MKSAPIPEQELINWLVSGWDDRVNRESLLYAYAMRNEYPGVDIPHTTDESARWRDYIRIDELADAIHLRHLDIDLDKNTGTLFYQHTIHWCFEHKFYMTASVEGGKNFRAHYLEHGYTDRSYNKMLEETDGLVHDA